MNATPAPSPAALDFVRDDEHKYWILKPLENLLGVTEVMDDNGFEVDPRHYVPGSSERGKFIHEVLADACLGKYPYMPCVEEQYQGWTQSGLNFLDFMLANGAVILGVEVMRFHPLYRFAGTIDLVVLWLGYEWVLDWKTGKAAKITRFKLAAYDALLGPAANGKQRKRAAVEIQRDGGRARLVEYNTPAHFHDANRFLSYLNTTRDRREFAPRERS